MSRLISILTRPRRRSPFILFWGWLFVLGSAFFLLISIRPNIFLYGLYEEGIVSDATFTAYNPIEVLFYSNLLFFTSLFSLLCLLWLLGAVGFLLRQKWSRLVLTVVMGLTSLVLLTVLATFLIYDYEITAWRDRQRNERFKILFPWALGLGSALLGWLIYKLNSPPVARKLS